MKILFPFATLVKIFSCTRLLSWYSSIKISCHFSWYCFATSVGSPFSSTKILRAKCSISLKSSIFFSFFFVANCFENSSTSSHSVFKMPYMNCKSSHASSEVSVNTKLLNSFFNFVLAFCASSFIANVTLLLGHFAHETERIAS